MGIRARTRTEALRAFLANEVAGGIVLLVAAAVALAWASSPWSEAYTDLRHTELTIGPVSEDLGHWVNDLLMALFFFVIGIEIKREVLLGDLRDPRRAALPVFAADRRRQAHRDPAGGCCRHARRSRRPIHRAGVVGARVHFNRGRAPAPEQLPPPGLVPIRLEGRPRGSPAPRLRAHRRHARRRHRRSPTGDHGPTRPRDSAAALRYQHVIAGQDAAIATSLDRIARRAIGGEPDDA